MTSEIDELKLQNQSLQQEIDNLQIRLKKYTTHPARKRYYEANKEKLDAKNREYLKSLDPEKLKEYRHTAYMNRKLKLQAEMIKE